MKAIGQSGIIEAEARDRGEWRALLAAHGIEARPAKAIPGFGARVLAAAKRDEAAHLERRALRWRWCTAAACAAIALFLLSHYAYHYPSSTSSSPYTYTSPYTSSYTSPHTSSSPSTASWLASRQAPDGTWMAPGADAAFRPALTALASLALSRQDAALHAKNISAAVAALETMQNEDGSFGAPGSHALYNHAFATFALIDDARRVGKGLTPAIARALDFSVASQNAFASWDYSPSGKGNDALAIWQLGILAEARSLGWSDGRGALRRGVSALARSGGGLLDYRLAFGRESAPAAGGIVLTRLATRSLIGFIDGIGGMESLSGNLAASLGTADNFKMRLAAKEGDDAILPAIVALLKGNDD